MGKEFNNWRLKYRIPFKIVYSMFQEAIRINISFLQISFVPVHIYSILGDLEISNNGLE